VVLVNILKNLPQHIKDVFVVSSDITPEEHIHMQTSIQAFVDNSISKTCNFPETATKEDVAKVYQMGWELGAKGLTVYVAGSRSEVVLRNS
jgi:ribonucleoside-diphosphate reductase alpha chain